MRGRDAAVAAGVWALFNAVLAAMLLGFRHHWFQVADYGLAVLGVAVVAVLALRAADRPLRRLPEASAGAALLATAIALVVASPAAGRWALWVGCGLVLVSLAVLARERAE